MAVRPTRPPTPAAESPGRPMLPRTWAARWRGLGQNRNPENHQQQQDDDAGQHDEEYDARQYRGPGGNAGKAERARNERDEDEGYQQAQHGGAPGRLRTATSVVAISSGTRRAPRP